MAKAKSKAKKKAKTKPPVKARVKTKKAKKPAPVKKAAKRKPAASKPRAAAPAKPRGVSPIPAGHHALTPHLVVKGGMAAIDFYKRAFGAVEQGVMPGPDGQSVMHAELTIGDSFFYLCDEFPMLDVKAPPSAGGTTCTMHLYVTNADTAFAKAVEAGAKVAMPLQDMFWGDRYGKLVDPFGHSWSIATHKEDLTPEQVQERAAAAFSGPPPGAECSSSSAPAEAPAAAEESASPAEEPAPV
jgi:PhnB protein